MSKINIDKITLKDNYLIPISKVIGDDETNKGCIIDATDKGMETFCNTKDGKVVLYAKIVTDTGIEAGKTENLNIFDLRKFIKLIDIIPEDMLVFTLNTNNLAYKTPDLSFKYHLMDAGIVQRSIVNKTKIESLKFDCEFILSYDKFTEILRASSFTEDSNKLYLSGNAGVITGELTDKTKANLDTVTLKITDAFIGKNFDNVILSLDALKKLVGLKFDKLNIKLNPDTKVLMFELSSNESVLKYIMTGLVK